MISSFANVVTRDEKAGQRLPNVPADLDATNAESIDDFTWKELLDQDACTKCGRCSSVCPAKASDRPLDPVTSFSTSNATASRSRPAATNDRSSRTAGRA